MNSVYIHIPFCKGICAYCDFPKILYNEELVNKYLDALSNEIKELYNNEPIHTIYIGGGTPSALNSYQLDKLFSIIEIFNTKELIEMTFECNIEDITTELINTLKKTKVNRISIGIQTFNKDLLKKIERKAEYDDTKNKIDLLKANGYTNINLDLMYALPNEKMSHLKRDLNLFIKLKPTHISTYSLILEKNTKLYINGEKNIDESLDSQMYYYIIKKLRKYKYNHYEVSNFSLTNYESKHNSKYWLNQEYYGFGLAAHGFIDGFRYENTHDINEYICGVYKLNNYLVSNQEMMENEIMLGLRLTKGINIKDFFDKYEVNIQDVFPIKPLIKSKELIYKDNYIYINPKYLYVMDAIIIKLV